MDKADEFDQNDAEHMLNEAKLTFERQLEFYDQVTSDSIEVIKIVLILTGVILSALRIIGLSQSEFKLAMVGVGIPLLISFFAAYLSYINSNLSVGFSNYGLRNITEPDQPPRSIEEMAQFYMRWIDENSDTAKKQRNYIRYSYFALSAAVGAFAALLYTT